MLCIKPVGSQRPIGNHYVLYEGKKKISGKSLQESFLRTVPVCDVVTDLEEYTLASTYPVSLTLSNSSLAISIYWQRAIVTAE